MNKLKHIVLIVALVAIGTALSSCCCHKKATQTNATSSVDYAAQGYTSATVISFVLDGCKWMLQLDSGEKLQPSGMTETFLKDQMKIWVKYEIEKGGMSTCMAGTMVKVTDIKERK